MSLEQLSRRKERLQWRNYPQEELIPHKNRSTLSHLYKVIETYGPALNNRELLKFLGIVGFTDIWNKANRSLYLKVLRHKLGKSLPPVSGVEEMRGGRKEVVQGTPWMMYLAKFNERKVKRPEFYPQNAVIPVIFDYEYDVHDPAFVEHVVGNMISSGSMQATNSFNTLLHCVIDPNSNARIPLKEMEVNKGSDQGYSSVLVIQENGSVVFMPKIPIASSWSYIHEQMKPEVTDGKYESLYHFMALADPAIDEVQAVVDCSKLSRSLGISPQMLYPTAQMGMQVITDPDDYEYRALRFFTSHLPVDGTAINQVALMTPHTLQKNFGIKPLERDKVTIVGDGSIDYLRPPQSKQQEIGLVGKPPLPYSMNVVAALAADQKFHMKVDPRNRKNRIRRASMPIAADSPVPMIGEKFADYEAQQINRVTIAQVSTDQLPLIDEINTVMDHLKAQKGDLYLRELLEIEELLQNKDLLDDEELVEKDSLLSNLIPDDMKERLISAFSLAFSTIKDLIDKGRRNEGSIELSEMFYGKDMDQGLANWGEGLMSREVREQIHGHVVVTNIDVNTILDGTEAVARFNTVHPMLGKVHSTLNLKPIQPREYIMKKTILKLKSLETENGDDVALINALMETELLPDKTLSIEAIRQALRGELKDEAIFNMFGLGERLFTDELKRETSSHLFSMYTKSDNPRREVTEYASTYMQYCHMISLLLRKIYRPAMRMMYNQ